MARQKGSIRFSGGLGELSFYRDKRYGDLVRRKGGPSKKQIQQLPSCKEVRQNNNEFGIASTASKLFRESFYVLLRYCRDAHLNARVQKRMMEILKSDDLHLPGTRTLSEKNFILFDRFELNTALSSSHYFPLPVQRSVINYHLFVEGDIVFPKAGLKAATHFTIVSVAAVLNFSRNEKFICTTSSPLQLIQDSPYQFTHLLTANDLVFHGMCVVFYQQINDEFYLLNDGCLNRGFIEYIRR